MSNPFLSAACAAVSVDGQPQTLALTGAVLSISDGNAVDFSHLFENHTHPNGGDPDLLDVFGNPIPPI